MTDRYSQIDIYEKGEFKNAFPLRINFPLNLTNYRYSRKDETEICKFITNRAVFVKIKLIHKN